MFGLSQIMQTYIHTPECTSTCVRANIPSLTQTHLREESWQEHARKYKHANVRHTYIHTYIHTYTHTHIHTYIQTCMHTYMHAFIHTYIHTYIHTLRHRFVPSPATPRILQTPHVTDFFLLNLCCAIPMPPGPKKDRGIGARTKRCRPTDLRLSTPGRKQHDIKSKGFRRTRISQRYGEVLQMQWSQLYTVDVNF